MGMKPAFLFLLVFITGCSSTSPYLGARLVGKYDIPSFSRAVEHRINPLGGGIAAPFFVAESKAEDALYGENLPSVEQWSSIKSKIKEGDQMWEFEDDRFGGRLDGPAYPRHLVYCVVRDGKILKELTIKIAENL